MEKTQTLFRPAIWSLFNIFFLLASASVQADESKTVSTLGPNEITTSAVQLGVLTCAARVEQVSTFLGFGPNTPATLRRPLAPADQNSFSLSGVLEAGGKSVFVTADFFPSPLGCKAIYNVTAHNQEPCETALSGQYSDLAPGIELANDLRILNGPNTMRIALMDAGEACVITKTETIE